MDQDNQTETDDSQAQYEMGLVHEQAENHAEATKCFRKAAQHGHREAQFRLALTYGGKQGGPDQDPGANWNEAAKWYRKAAGQGYPPAQTMLGLLYEYGAGVRKNLDKAIAAFEEAAQGGHPEGASHLARLAVSGKLLDPDEGATQPTKVQITKWVQRAAELGDRDAQYNLGVFYERGIGMSRDYFKAVAWYERAASQEGGHRRAQFNLARLYASGKGIPPESSNTTNLAEAAQWLHQAAQEGHTDAQVTLGIWYELGRGVGRNPSEAVLWFRKAADRGFPEAQFHLAKMYAKGSGVEGDMLQAYMWYLLAHKGLHQRGKSEMERTVLSKLGDVKMEMNESEIMEAERLARQWTADE